MNEDSSTDPAFEEFLRTPAGQEEGILSRLISTDAEPLIREILNHKIRRYASFRADAEDLHNDIIAALLSRMRSIRGSAEENSISSFRNYVATVAYNVCNQYFRRRSPRREAFQNRLRYILRHDPRFAMWRKGAKWLCGNARWNGRLDVCDRERIDHLDRPPSGANERDKLEEIFKHLQAPVPLDDLMGLFADFWREATTQNVNDMEPASAQPGAESPVLQRSNVERAWSEIRQLPVKQRVALLLSLRDDQGDGMLVALPATGIASIRKIAETLEMSAETLAAVWNDLPLEDLRIAELLNVPRQQVINLRKSARERLGRRLSGMM